MAYYVYVLTNPGNRTYVGQTNNVELRLARHNRGLVRSTASHRPWKVLLIEKHDSRGVAMKRERELKKGQGRAYIHEMLRSSIGPPEAD